MYTLMLHFTGYDEQLALPVQNGAITFKLYFTIALPVKKSGSLGNTVQSRFFQQPPHPAERGYDEKD